MPLAAYFFTYDVLSVLKFDVTKATIGDTLVLGVGVIFGILFVIGYIWGFCKKKSAGRWLMYYALLGLILGYIGFFIVFLVIQNFAKRYEILGYE